MAVYSLNDLKTRVNTYIKQNLNREITGPVLQTILQDVIDSLNALSSTVSTIVRSAGNVNAAGGIQVIIFSTPLATANYSLSIFDINGLGIKATAQSENGFTINALTAGTFNYIAIINI